MAYHARKLLRVIKGLVLVGVAVLAIGDSVAYAASNEGPIHIDDDGSLLVAPNNSYGNSYPTRGRGWDYVVSNDNYTDVWSSDVLVYSTTQNPTIRIIGSDLCTNNTPLVRGGDVAYSPAMPTGRMVNEYRLYTFDPRPGATYGNGVSVAYERGLWNYTAAATCNAKEVTLTPTGFSMIDPGTGRYVYRINALANRATGGQFANSFHVIAPTGAIVTQSSDAGFSGFGMQASYPVPDGAAPNTPTPPDPYRVYSDLFIPFGPDCTLTTATDTKSLIITDADNQGQFSVQPQPFRIAVQAFTRSTGVYRGYVPLTWRDVGAGTAVDVSGGARTVWEPGGGNQTGVLFDFTVEQGVIYRLVISRVYYNNTLEFRLPYDGAHYYLPCNQPTHIRPVVTMSPAGAAENGQQLTGTTSIINSTNNTTSSAVNYTRQVWADRNRNNVFDAGDTSLLGPQSGATTVPPSPGTRPIVPDWTAIADSGVMGGRVCIILSISASPPVVVDPPATTPPACVDIGKRPKLHVSTGDVMVGGTFRNLAGICTTQTLSATNLQLRGSISTIGGVTYSSYADYAANSLGPISVFGTNGVNPGTAPADNMSFGNDIPLGHFFSNAGSPPSNPTQARCLNDPFAVFAPRASSSNAATTIDVSNVGADTLATASGTLSINGTTRQLPAGYKRVIYAPNASTVEITSDIAYSDGPYNSPTDLPQLVILTNGRIVVRAGVTRIDGIYAAKGDFQTCEVAPLLGTCTQPLTIHGAVIAGGRVVPYRTAGADGPNYGDKAEVFRLRPDLLLNQLPGAGGSQSVIKTIDQREVPPRF